MQLCGVLSSGGAAASDTYERILSTVGNESRPARLCWPRGTTSGPGTAGASRSSRQRCRCGFKHGGAGSPWEASNTAALVARGRQCLRNAIAMSAHCIQEGSSTNQRVKNICFSPIKKNKRIFLFFTTNQHSNKTHTPKEVKQDFVVISKSPLFPTESLRICSITWWIDL
jgi:hypothetical protein